MSDNLVEFEISLKDLFSDKIKDVGTATAQVDTAIKLLRENVGDTGKKLIDFGLQSMEVSNKYDGLTEKIKGSSVDIADGGKNIDYLQDAVYRLHMPMEEAYENFGKLQDGMAQTGISGNGLRNVFEGVGEAGEALNLSPDQMSGTIDALNSIGASGTVQADQLAELQKTIPGTMAIAAQSMGMTQEEFKKNLDDGLISSADFIQNFSGSLQTKFSAEADAAGNTVKAKFTDVSNVFYQMQVGVGQLVKGLYDDAVVAFDKYNQVVEIGKKGVALFTTVQEAFNIVMEANPVGAVVLAITALVTAVVLAYEKVSWFRAGLWAAWSVIKEFGSIMSDLFTGIGHMIHGALTLNPGEIANGLSSVVDTVANAGKRIGTAAKNGYEEGMADFKASHSSSPVANAKITAQPLKQGPAGATGGKGEAAPAVSPKGARGSGSVTVNVTIGKLIEKFNINTTNISEGSAKVQQMVANVLLQAVNDSTLVANI